MVFFKIKFSSILIFWGCLFFLTSCHIRNDNSIAVNEEKTFYIPPYSWKSKSITQLISGISYKVTEVPLQYYIYKNEGVVNIDKADSIYQSSKNERILEIEFQEESKDDLFKSKYTHRDYESAVKYMSFEVINDFKITLTNGKVIDCSGVTLERNFQLAPFKRLLLYFGNIPEQESIQLVYDDQLFGNGLMKFQFKEIPLKL